MSKYSMAQMLLWEHCPDKWKDERPDGTRRVAMWTGSNSIAPVPLEDVPDEKAALMADKYLMQSLRG